MFENVRGMMYGNRWYLDQILAELRDLGYEVDLRILNSVHFGVPQKRERLVVVGHLGGFVFPAPSAKVWTSADAWRGCSMRRRPNRDFLRRAWTSTLPTMKRRRHVFDRVIFIWIYQREL
ncbi:DNA cytosine methyltransferase [Verrucomicrobium spinosum]|uniref:DNA cytosine methyltransferase n=1 Tax=Verrucomicrobium spinosum TaxID=2736 RepID=UPI0031B5C4C8